MSAQAGPVERLLAYIMTQGGHDRHERMIDLETVQEELDRLRKPVDVDITSDGVNPSTYTVPEGVVVTISQTGPDVEDMHSITMVGPYEGGLPEPDDPYE